MLREGAHQFGHAEILERRAEIDRREMAFVIAMRREVRQARLCQLRFLFQLGEHLRFEVRAHGIAADALTVVRTA